MPVAAIPARGGIVARRLSARSRSMRRTSRHAASGLAGTDGSPARAAHAESAHANESADATCNQRSHRDDRAGHRRRDLSGRARSGGISPTARPTHPGHRGNHAEVSGRQLATGGLVRASTVPPALPDLSTTNRRLRSGNREAVRRLRTTCRSSAEAVAGDRKRNRNASKKRNKRGRPAAGFDLRTEAYKLFGVDVTQVPGVKTSVLPLFSEVGRDLASRWPPLCLLVESVPG